MIGLVQHCYKYDLTAIGKTIRAMGNDVSLDYIATAIKNVLIN